MVSQVLGSARPVHTRVRRTSVLQPSQHRHRSLIQCEEGPSEPALAQRPTLSRPKAPVLRPKLRAKPTPSSKPPPPPPAADSASESQSGPPKAAKPAAPSTPSAPSPPSPTASEAAAPVATPPAAPAAPLMAPPKRPVRKAPAPAAPPRRRPPPSANSSGPPAAAPGKPSGPRFRNAPKQPGAAPAPKKKSSQPSEEQRLQQLKQAKKAKSKSGGKSGTMTASNRRKSRAQRKEEREEKAAPAAEKEEIFEVGAEGMSVPELAGYLAVHETDVIKTLFMKGVMAQVNQTLDPNAVKVVAAEFGVEVLDRGAAAATQGKPKMLSESDKDFLVSRPAVVSVMGHVDHGKTSLLDHIRKSKVAAGEAGGITQAIGAYNVEVPSAEGPKRICFLDTPGHEAFSAMRARGASVTDVAIIMVAADDGVRPQTVEAVAHCQAAGVPIVVAINKCDKEGAAPDRVKQELGAQTELFPEEWGGGTPMVEISAKKGQGIDELLETLQLVAELEELQANPAAPGVGTVIEAHLDRQIGPVATMLVQNGTLRVGDVVNAGSTFGKVRSLTAAGGVTQSAGPSEAVQLLGLNAVPDAGDRLRVCGSEQEARTAAEEVLQRLRKERLGAISGGGSMVTLSSLASVEEDDEALQRINIILRADASGTLEAVKGALNQLPQNSVMLRFLHTAAGDLTQSDIDLAAASGGLVLGFNIEPSEAVLAGAKQKGVQIRTYKIIYELLDDVRAAMEGRLKAVEERVHIGDATVKAVFASGSRNVAGCEVVDGVLEKGCTIVVTRKRKVVFDGVLHSLRRVKDAVKTVEAGLECGVGSDDWQEWQEGDSIEAFSVIGKQLTLEESSATQAVNIQQVLADLDASMSEEAEAETASV